MARATSMTPFCALCVLGLNSFSELWLCPHKLRTLLVSVNLLSDLFDSFSVRFASTHVLCQTVVFPILCVCSSCNSCVIRVYTRIWSDCGFSNVLRVLTQFVRNSCARLFCCIEQVNLFPFNSFKFDVWLAHRRFPCCITVTRT